MEETLLLSWKRLFMGELWCCNDPANISRVKRETTKDKRTEKGINKMIYLFIHNKNNNIWDGHLGFLYCIC